MDSASTTASATTDTDGVCWRERSSSGPCSACSVTCPGRPARAVLDGLAAFLTRPIVPKVLSEDLPNGRDDRLAAFATGAVLYAGLLPAV